MSFDVSFGEDVLSVEDCLNVTYNLTSKDNAPIPQNTEITCQNGVSIPITATVITSDDQMLIYNHSVVKLVRGYADTQRIKLFFAVSIVNFKRICCANK